MDEFNNNNWQQQPQTPPVQQQQPSPTYYQQQPPVYEQQQQQQQQQQYYQQPPMTGANFVQDQNYPSMAQTQKTFEKENVVAGIVGAFLFSLIGGVLWFLIYQLGRIAAICGLVTVVCACFGYKLFGKAQTVKGVVISIIVSIIVIALAEYTSLAYEIYTVYKDMYAITFFDAFRSGISFLSEKEILGAVISDLAFGYILGFAGSFAYLKNAISESRARKKAQLEQF